VAAGGALKVSVFAPSAIVLVKVVPSRRQQVVGRTNRGAAGESDVAVPFTGLAAGAACTQRTGRAARARAIQRQVGRLGDDRAAQERSVAPSSPS